MALPRQVSLTIKYDGAISEAVSTTASGESGGAGGASGLYTVVSGDTLWAIAKRYYGSGTKYTIIYDANAELIESTARAHGKADSENGHWIWPGETLVIPGIGIAKESSTVTMRTDGTSDPELGTMIAKAATEISYTDVANGKSDSVSIKLHDISKEWMGPHMPRRGASFGVNLLLTNWNGTERVDSFDCGTFVLDDLSFSGRPLSCDLNGVSVPAMNDFKSLPKTKTWEQTTIEEIASEITQTAGVSLYYDADTIQIAELEQTKQTDSAFLYSLCERYGLAMKVYNQKIVIFDAVKSEECDAVLTIHEDDMISWSYNTTIEGTYTGVNLDYTDPDTENTINVTMGVPGRMYAINTQASGRYDAELQAAAKVNAANRAVETMKVTIMANIQIIASQCVQIEGLGNIDGKYYIDSIVHSIGSRYTMQLALHRVQPAIMVTGSSTATSGGRKYTVVSGDTLWAIAKRYYGSGTKYTIIYGANVELIESTARAHGKPDSENGHWIWPGETLVIPEV